jgi:hypothetical protein
VNRSGRTKDGIGVPLAPEDRLVLLLARGKIPPPVQERALALLATPLRWDVILERATAQEVYPLLYRNLRTLGFPGVPEEAHARLRDLSKIDAFRNTLLTEELVRVLTLLAEAGVSTIPVKGVALAESLYGDLTLRSCVDTDILVPRRMVARALHLLLDIGYRSEFTERFFAELFLRHDIEYALVREERELSYMLELHWGVLWGGRLDKGATEDLWAEACSTAVFGVPAYVLSPEWQILFLAAHAARHQWQGLKWLVDIHELCSSGRIEWENVWEKTKRLGWEEVLRLTLHSCHRLFDTPAGEDVSSGEFPPWIKLFPHDPSRKSWPGIMVNLHLLRHPSDRLRYIMRHLLVPTLAERRLLRLPSPLGFLYYPLRPLRLAFKWAWRLAVAGFRKLIRE